MNANGYLSKAIKWNATGDAEFPYSAMLEGKSVRIRLNDFPADNLYTLIVVEAEFGFDDWPSVWSETTNKKVPKSNEFPRGRLGKGDLTTPITAFRGRYHPSYDAEDAKRTWERTLDFFRNNLK